MAARNLRQAGAIADYDKASRNQNPLSKYNGVSSKMFPHSKRQGLASIMDSNFKASDAKKNEAGLGSGAVTMVFKNEDGTEIPQSEASMNIGGITFTPGKSGFRLVDEGYLEEKYEIEKER